MKRAIILGARALCCLSIGVLLKPLAASAAYPDTILSDHPVAYYRLEELTGASTAADSSGNGLDATYVGNNAGTSPQLGLPGIDTNSVAFNGGTDPGSVRIPYDISLSPTN